MSTLLKEPMFFYSISFVLFLALAFHYGRKPLFSWLDKEILKISVELDYAKKLRAEAEATLADYKKKQAEALADAVAITAHAKQEAARLQIEAEASLKASLARHEQQALERIRLAEAEALAAVHAATVDLAMKLAEKVLAEKIDDATASTLTDQAIAALPKPAKAQAA